MIIAIDTGGTKTLVGRFTDNGTLETTTRFATPTDVTAYIKQVVETITMITEGAPVTDISIGLPGTITGGVATYCINLGWCGVPIHNLLAEHFPNTQIILENDANLAGLASIRRLEPQPACGLYVTIGTGIGTSIILNGTLHPSLRSSEAGHMQVAYQSTVDSWENLASGRALSQQFGELSDTTPPEVWLEAAKRLSLGLQALTAAIQPDVIVIGGGVGRYTDKFSASLAGFITEKLPSFITCPHIVGAAHPEEAVLYGCYDNAILHR